MAASRAVLPDRGPHIATPGHFGDIEIVRVDLKTRTATFRVRAVNGLTGPDTRVPLSMVRLPSEEDAGRFWKMLVDDLFRSLEENGQLPEFVKGYEVTTGEDSTGEPALYVKILVKPAHSPASDATVSRWNEFSNLVQDTLMQLRLQPELRPRWPYVQLGEWRRKR
jgi:hypothetical protein